MSDKKDDKDKIDPKRAERFGWSEEELGQIEIEGPDGQPIDVTGKKEKK